jgi:hypothetical protein
MNHQLHYQTNKGNSISHGTNLVDQTNHTKNIGGHEEEQ